jgi:hypothetical protein
MCARPRGAGYPPRCAACARTRFQRVCSISRWRRTASSRRDFVLGLQWVLNRVRTLPHSLRRPSILLASQIIAVSQAEVYSAQRPGLFERSFDIADVAFEPLVGRAYDVSAGVDVASVDVAVCLDIPGTCKSLVVCAGPRPTKWMTTRRSCEIRPQVHTMPHDRRLRGFVGLNFGTTNWLTTRKTAKIRSRVNTVPRGRRLCGFVNLNRDAAQTRRK